MHIVNIGANEDRYLLKQIGDYKVFAVADGMGGLDYGDVVAEIIIDVINSITHFPEQQVDLFLANILTHSNK